MTSAADWNRETRRYDEPHPRLVQMAHLLTARPGRMLLDVGCSTGTLRRIIPAEYDYYGCDVTDLAEHSLPKGHFRRMDFNRDVDFDWVRPVGIEKIHLGGVLEYLGHPENLLRALRSLVRGGDTLVLSIINFEAERYAEATSHHPWWVYKPNLETVRSLLGDCGWTIDSESAFLRCGGFAGWRLRREAARRGNDSPKVRRDAEQFLFTASAA